jgi:hypothetical protein
MFEDFDKPTFDQKLKPGKISKPPVKLGKPTTATNNAPKSDQFK